MIMRFLDRPFAIAAGMFLAGTSCGVASIITAPWVQTFFLRLVEARMLSPINFALTNGGELAVFILVFANNSALALLSFLYPFLVATVHWVPELTRGRRMILLASFTLLTAFVVGFFGFGGIMALEWIINGRAGVLGLLAKAWLHGPIELGLILVCVSEPLRLAGSDDASEIVNGLRRDLRVLCIALIGLIVAAALEVYSLT